ncbi:MAG: chorismate mutase [Alphaproteobacteria bacterium]|nr:chorismate mutase [Alphaproteobacteria bacterium]MCB9974782.1 chorismate mutase [Rhodospirillales bacterium]
MSKTLNDIRAKIDEIDNTVHDLLMERASLVFSIAEAKRKSNLQMVQPAREARMIRRLLERHEGPLPRQAVVRIWRELVGAVALLQTGLTVIVFSEEEGSAQWDMAKDYFGTIVPMKKTNSASGAIGAVRSDESSFAVLPWPELDQQDAWWANLLEQPGEKISIICALPYGLHGKNGGGLSHRALVVSKFEYLPSDDDYSFIGLELSSSISRTRVVERLGKMGLDIVNLYSSKFPSRVNSTVHLVEAKGYIASDNEILDKIRQAFEGDCRCVGVLGGYPAVPELDE